MKTNRAPRGTVPLDDIKLEGGIVVKVWLDKETGVFHARYHKVFHGDHLTAHDGESWEGKDLEQLRNDVRAWARAEKALKWEPVIAVGDRNAYGMSEGKDVLGHRFVRLMRAKKHHGEDYEWRHWAYSKPRDGGPEAGAFIYDKDLEVYPPSSTAMEPRSNHNGDDVQPIVIPYTPERWLALLQLRDMELALRDRLKEIIGSGETAFTKMLTKVPAMGLLGLSKEDK